MLSSRNADVSVIMACHNSSEFLDEAIRSILEQTLTNFEFIIIDDASTDNTTEIIKTYAAGDRRIVYQSLSVNSGPAVARNKGLEIARGKWIAILDSDDLAFPNRLELQLQHVDSHSGVVLLGSSCIEIDSAGTLIKKHEYPYHHEALVKRLETIGAFFSHSSSFYMKECVNRIGNYNKRLVPSEDYDLWLRLSEIGQVACISLPLIKLRNHQKSISNDNQRRTQTMNCVAAGVCHFLRLRNVNDPSRLDNSDWFRFIDWLVAELEQKGYFHKIRFHYDLRQAWYSGRSRTRLRSGFDFIKLAMAHPSHLSKIALQSFFDSTLLPELADEWIQLSKIDMCSRKASEYIHQ